jgi:hypothetical protein
VNKLGRSAPTRPAAPPTQLPYSLAVGVGQQEESVSSVGRADIARSKSLPLRIEPERGKVPENSVQPPAKESCDVFNEDEAGS